MFDTAEDKFTMSNNRYTYILLILSVLVLASAQGAGYSHDYTVDGVTLGVTADDEGLGIADEYEVAISTVSVSPCSADITFEQSDGCDFELVEPAVEAGSRVENEKIVKRYVLKFSPLKTGACVLKGITVKVTGSDVKGEGRVELEPIEFNVASSLTKQDVDRIKKEGVDPLINESMKLEPVVSIPYDKRIISAAAAGVILLLAVIIVLAVKWKRARARRIVYVPLNYLVRSVIGKLSRLELATMGQYDLYYQKVCDVLRYYLEYRFDLKARDMTTEEFLERLRESSELDTETKADLKYFMEHCDMVKFARYVPDTDQISYVGRLLEEFVDKTADPELKVPQSVSKVFDRVLEGEK